MRRLFTLLVLLVAAALPFMSASATGSTTLFNDVNSDAYGLRVTFTEPVSIARMGEGFARWEAEENGKTIVFFEGKIGIWGNFFFFWEPENAEVMSHHWLLQAPSYEPAISSLGPDSENVGGQDALSVVYLDVPKLRPTPQGCFDCKTYALISVMRYYGDDASFEDICALFGGPPKGNFTHEEDIAFCRKIFDYAERRGFTVETHLWHIDAIIKEVARGRPVIANYRIGQYPSEPGVVKGFDEGHVWTYGVQEALHRPGVDVVYTMEQLEGLLDMGSRNYGPTGGYVPHIWRRPFNCWLVYRDAVPKIGHELPSDIGVAGTIRWSGSLKSGFAKEIEITIYDEDYISWENGKATTRFAVTFDRSLGWGSVIQNFANKKNWSLPGRFFEEVRVSLEISESGVGWRGTVTIVPCASMHYLSVLQPPQPDCPNITVLALVDDEAHGSTSSPQESEVPATIRNTPECDGKAGSDWETPMLVSTDALGDASHPAGDITALYLRTDETYLHVQLALAAAAQPSIRYSVNLHPAGSSECYSLHAGGEGMHGPRGFICEIEYAIGEVVEFAVPLDVLRELGLTVFNVSADSRAFGASWADRYDDIQQKDFRLD